MEPANLADNVKQWLHRLPGDYAAYYGVRPPAPPQTSIAAGNAGATLARAQAALGEAAALERGPVKASVPARILVRREALSSLSIEGIHATLDELLSVEETGQEAVARPESRQARDYALALESLVPQAMEVGSEIFTVELVQQLHAAAMLSVPSYPDKPGEFRTRVIWIGGTGHIATSSYNPPAPELVPECIDEHIEYLRCEGEQAQTQGLIVRMAIAHAHFEAVHPFRDGNGRVGRLLLPLMMAADGAVPLYLSPYIEAHKQQYYEALKAAQHRLEYEAIIGYLSDAISGTVHEIKRLRDALVRLKAAWRKRRNFRAGSAADAALVLLHEYPVITVGRLEQMLGVSFQAASTAAKQLESVGILTERTGYRRNRVFAATEVLGVLNRPYGANT